MKTQWDNSWSV